MITKIRNREKIYPFELSKLQTMPEISRFFGIIITFYADDHNPPHFHARYAEFFARIIISSADLLDGNLPNKQLRLVQAWAEIHRE